MIANAYNTPKLSDFGRFGLLLAIALVYAEGNGRIERLRRFVGGTGSHILADASSLWCFAAALVLPIGLAGALAAAVYAHAVLRMRQHGVVPPFRMIFTGSVETLSVLCAATVVVHFGGIRVLGGDAPVSLLVVGAAMLTYAIVNQVVIVSAVYLMRRPIPIRSIVGGVDEQLTEFATLTLAVLFAVTIAHAPVLAPIALVVIVVLRRSALVRQLQQQATRDAKTGLLNAGAWRQEAERELVRGERLGTSMSVLMIDLDHFKRLNDEYGHPAGDAALKAVAGCLTEALRGYDAVGRFGGEEFIALLANGGEQVSSVVAERLRARIASLELEHGGVVTASIGVGIGVADEHSLDDLIAVADKALYIAKRSGRNKVHVSQAAAATVSWPSDGPTGASER